MKCLTCGKKITNRSKAYELVVRFGNGTEQGYWACEECGQSFDEVYYGGKKIAEELGWLKDEDDEEE